MALATPLPRRELEDLYLALEKPVYNVVYRWLWHREEAMEVVQEAFLKLWQKSHSQTIDDPRAYLYRTAINLAKNRQRTLRVRNLFATREWMMRQGTTDDGRSADDDLEQRLDNMRVHIEKLPSKLREVVTLSELTDMSYADVAKILKIKAGTVASRRHRALARLRKSLEDDHA